MTSNRSTSSTQHKNDEKTVRCPVEGCDKELLSRGLHLHVRRSSGNGHGPQDKIPNDINLDDAEVVGSREVEMEYPEEREAEQVPRLCPYCERPFRGKHGVMIHLGQTAGRKNHPPDAPERHDLEDFPAVEVDNEENIVEVVEEGTVLPATRERRKEEKDERRPDPEMVEQHIQDLREKGLDGEADRAEQMLLGN